MPNPFPRRNDPESQDGPLRRRRIPPRRGRLEHAPIIEGVGRQGNNSFSPESVSFPAAPPPRRPAHRGACTLDTPPIRTPSRCGSIFFSLLLAGPRFAPGDGGTVAAFAWRPCPSRICSRACPLGQTSSLPMPPSSSDAALNDAARWPYLASGASIEGDAGTSAEILSEKAGPDSSRRRAKTATSASSPSASAS